MATLLNSSSDSEVELHINQNYAEKYDKWREKEELQKLKDRYGKVDSSSKESSSSSSSSESEDEGESWTPDNEKSFLKALSLLKSKDPKIYDENVSFFHHTTHNSPKQMQNKKSKPLMLRDFERNLILEKRGQLSDDEREPQDHLPPSYFEEQHKIKESFKAVLHDSGDNDDTLLVKRKKSKEEQAAEEADYLQWLKGEKSLSSSKEKDLEFLHSYWNNPSLGSEEAFLKDYILNKRYLEKNATNKIPTYEEIVDDGEGLSEDEKVLEKQEVFEHKFNFRFEEPDQEFIKRYPRTVKDSLRRKDSHRKDKRNEYKERKRKEKELKREELKRLKALKRKEIMEKIEKLKEVTGNAKIGFEEMDISEDFDPQKYDQRMNAVFGDDYYAVDEGDEKPNFPPDEELDTEENWEHWEEEKHVHNEDDDGPHCEDPDFNMDADYNPNDDLKNEMLEASRKKKRKSKLAEALLRKKPVFDPSLSTFEDYFDEYYKLDFEDVIGDLPCRFHYRKVVPNDFGLSTEEMLWAKDKELNQWCSLKKTCQYRTEMEEKYDIQAFKKKAQNTELKKKIIHSLYQDEDIKIKELPKHKKRRRKRNKLHHNEKQFMNYAVAKCDGSPAKVNTNIANHNTELSDCKMLKQPNEERIVCPDENNDHDNTQKVNKTDYKQINTKIKCKKEDFLAQKHLKKFGKQTSHNELDTNHMRNRNFKKSFKAKDSKLELSNERLKAYGINPKKFRNKLLYGTVR